MQISSLVTLQLMTQVSHDDQLDAPKYKCAVSMDFICAISKCVFRQKSNINGTRLFFFHFSYLFRGSFRTVNFDIVKYLYDFL